MKLYRRLLLSIRARTINLFGDSQKDPMSHRKKKDKLLTLVMKRKVRWFGHVSRSSGLAKTSLQCKVKEKEKRGRQKNR